MSDRTPQQLGYDWDYEVADRIGGTRHTGSGNRPYAKLDASGNELIVSGKYVGHASFSLKEEDLDEAKRAALGPEAASSGATPILAVKFKSGRTVAVVDLDTLMEWLRSPPELLPSTKQDQIRKTARTASLLRGT